MVSAQPGANLWRGWQPSLWPRVHWSGSNSTSAQCTRTWYLVWVLPFLNIRQTCSQLSCANSHWKTQAILGERKQMQVRVCIGVGGSWGRIVRGLEWWWEKPGCQQGLSLRNPRQRQMDSVLSSTLSQQKLLLVHLSDFSNKKSLNLQGRVQADAKFPSHDGCERKWGCSP